MTDVAAYGDEDVTIQSIHNKGVHANSALFDIVILKKHARINTCISRIYVTLSTNEKLTVVADVLSFICECSGFRHNGIRSTDISTDFDKRIRTELEAQGYGWDYFYNCFSDVPTTCTFEQVKRDCNTVNRNPSPKGIFPEISDVLENKKNSSWASLFYTMCTSRIKHISTLLDVKDGWAIGYGKRNVAYLRFKEFFHQIVSNCELQHLPNLFELLQWIFCLSLCGFRAVRQLASILCDELITMLLIKLQTLERQEATFIKQLTIELEMDKRAHIRSLIYPLPKSITSQMNNLDCNGSTTNSAHTNASTVVPSGSNASGTGRVTGIATATTDDVNTNGSCVANEGKSRDIRLANSTVELWRQMRTSRAASKAIYTFVQLVYAVNYTCKLRDVMVDNAVTCAFRLGYYLTLAPQIYSQEYYWRFALNVIPKCDENVRLLLLRYVAMLDLDLSREMLTVVVDLYFTSLDAGDTHCCEVIECILLQFVERPSKSYLATCTNYTSVEGTTTSASASAPESAAVASPPPSVRHYHALDTDVELKRMFLRLLMECAKRTSKVLSVLLARIFFSKVPIVGFQLALTPTLEGLKSRYKSIILIPVHAITDETKIVINHDVTLFPDVDEAFRDIIEVLTETGVDAQSARQIVASFLNGIWDNCPKFKHVDVLIQMLSKGTDPSASVPLDHVAQAVLMQAVLTCMLKLHAGGESSAVVRIVSTAVGHIPMLLNRFRANGTNWLIATELCEHASFLARVYGIQASDEVIASVCNACVRAEDSESEQTISLVRTLHNLYTGSPKNVTNLQNLYRELIQIVRTKEQETGIRALVQLIHFCPVELDVDGDFLNYIGKKLQGRRCYVSWCGLAMVIYEAHVYRLLRCGNCNTPLSPKLIELVHQFMSRLATMRPASAFDKYVTFCSICSTVQIANLVGGITVSDEISIELFNIMEWFLSQSRSLSSWPSACTYQSSSPSFSSSSSTTNGKILAETHIDDNDATNDASSNGNENESHYSKRNGNKAGAPTRTRESSDKFSSAQAYSDCAAWAHYDGVGVVSGKDKKNNNKNTSVTVTTAHGPTCKNLEGACTLVEHIVGNVTELDLSPTEATVRLINHYSRTLSFDLYGNSVSCLIILLLRLENGQLYKACVEFLKFVASFNAELLHGLLLYTMIGLYESPNRPVAFVICSHFIKAISTARDTVVVEKTIAAGVQYAAQSQANWEFMSLVQLYTTKYKDLEVQFSSGLVRFLESLSSMANDELQLRIRQLVRLVGEPLEDDQEPTGNVMLNILRTKPQMVKFAELGSPCDGDDANDANGKRKRPASTCLVKRKNAKAASQKTGAGDAPTESADTLIEVSPIVARNLTRSVYPPSVGIIGSRVPKKLGLSDVDLEDLGEIEEFEPVEEVESDDTTNASGFSSSSGYACPSVGTPKHS